MLAPAHAAASRSVADSVESPGLEKAALHALSLGVVISDLDGVVVYCNPAAARMHGYAVEELQGCNTGLISPADLERPPGATPATTAGWRREAVNLRKDGSTFFVSLSSDVLADEDGRPVAVATTCEDITDRKQAEAALRESEVHDVLALEAARAGLWDWDLRTGTIRFSPSWKSLFGLTGVDESPEQWLGRLHPDDAEPVKAELARHLGSLGQRFEIEHRLRDGQGDYRWVMTRGMALRGPDGQAYRSVGSQADITERWRADQRRVENALRDALTGLPNRAVFMDRLGRATEGARRGQRQRFAVLVLDLDRFQVVNDTLGAAAGDELLREAARRLATCLRPSDTVARFGGDEFAVLLAEVAGGVDATRVADRIQRGLASPFDLGGREVRTTASIGIALSGEHYSSPDEILNDADTAMYRAKAQGRARHQLFDTALQEQAMARLELEAELRRAVERGEFVVHYQPVAWAATGEVCRVEALLRWQHPRRGLLPPSEFVALAEESGLMVPIGEWLLRTAAAQVQEWNQFGGRALGLAVNLTARQLREAELPAMVAEALGESGLPPRLLDLELPEGVLMENAEAALGALGRLKRIGVQLSIDNFGSGCSSMASLGRLPVDALKVDRSFIQRIVGDPSGAAIVLAMIALAHGLGLRVAAPGVETPEQLDFLRSHGCDEVQGLLFGAPHPELRGAPPAHRETSGTAQPDSAGRSGESARA